MFIFTAFILSSSPFSVPYGKFFESLVPSDAIERVEVSSEALEEPFEGVFFENADDLFLLLI